MTDSLRVGGQSHKLTDVRKGDDKNIAFFRSSDRFVRIDGQWWFTTREGQEGPFASREAATVAALRFVTAAQALDEISPGSGPTFDTAKNNPRPALDTTLWDRQIDAS